MEGNVSCNWSTLRSCVLLEIKGAFPECHWNLSERGTFERQGVRLFIFFFFLAGSYFFLSHPPDIYIYMKGSGRKQCWWWMIYSMILMIISLISILIFKGNPAGSQIFLAVNPPFVCHSNIKAVCSLCFCRRHKNPIPTSTLRKESRQDKGKKKIFWPLANFFLLHPPEGSLLTISVLVILNYPRL